MNNKEVVNKIYEAFRGRDINKMLPYITDDFTWHINGELCASNNKEAIKQIEDERAAGTPVIDVKNMISENDLVIAEGDCECEMKEHGLVQVHFCDVYRFENGKVKAIRAYVIGKK